VRIFLTEIGSTNEVETSHFMEIYFEPIVQSGRAAVRWNVISTTSANGNHERSAKQLPSNVCALLTKQQMKAATGIQYGQLFDEYRNSSTLYTSNRDHELSIPQL
jgi:hypothetical protein